MIDTEANLAHRLRRARWIASGLLILAAIVFVLTSFLRSDWPLLNPLWAFSEAALIGGLADWFAVTALFRRPLGLPIPHTAIVPARKDQIGQSLARFVAEHFLVRSALAAELDRLKPARAFGVWLSKRENAAGLSRDAARGFRWLAEDSGSGPLREALTSNLSRIFRTVPTERLLAALLDVLASGPHSDELIDGLVAIGNEQLERNKAKIRERIRERSPWWLPKFVDEEIFDQLTGEVQRILDEIGDNAEHPARAALKDRIRTLQTLVAGDADFVARTETMREEFLNHPAVVSFGRDLSLRIRSDLIEALNDADSDLRLALTSELVRFGTTLAREPELADRLDSWLSEAIIYIVETYAEPMSSVISRTIEKWDANETSRRIELHIGRDLQFIRINGTLVGGLVGVVLYLSWFSIAG